MKALKGNRYYRWEYDKSHFGNTVQERWDLVCSNGLLPRLAQTMFFCGNMAGVFMCGMAADYWGRKPVLMISLSTWIISAVLGSIVQNFAVWTTTRFFVGAATLSMNTCISVYIAESCSSKMRPFVSAMTSGLGWSIGHMTVTLLVYCIPNMKTFEIVMGLFGLLFLPLWWAMKESPRWLLAKGQEQKANGVLRALCSMNRRPFTYVEKEKGHLDGDSKGHIMDLLRYKGIRRNFLSMCFCWLSFSMGYFGLLYNTPATQGNVYIVFLMPTFATPFYILIYPLLQRKLGRKVMLSFSLILAGLFMILTFALSKDQKIALITLSCLGVLACGAAFDTGYIFTKELFPTVLRTSALSSASAAARIGSLLAPLIGALDVVNPVLPLTVYGLVVLLAGIQSIIIWPDTTHTKLPDTVVESEIMTESANTWLKCCKKCQAGPHK